MQQIALNDLARHVSTQREALMDAMTRVLDRGWFVLGPELEAFESEFAAYCGMPHAIGVANGTDAIELALRALGIGAGDEVILAANAGMYSTTALRAIGITPVFADVDDRHLVLDAACVDAALTPRTRAVIATHLYGRMADITSLRALADRAGIALIEDCAQAHGARQQGRLAGSLGDAACFSFYPTKNLGALGDAGLVACRDASVAQRVRRLRQYGWDQKYVAIDGPARNSRLDELQAAILRVVLPLLDGWNARRRQIARHYAAIEHPALRHPDVDGEDYVAHLYVVRTHARDSLRQHLASHGIASDIHYPLLDTQQPVLRGLVADSALPISAAAANQVLSLPCYPELTDAEVQRVCAALACWTP
jgi:dTDP-3-amino-2,3,6-trideoxy-4-keto-D-glucose/dTDP-3-amino-3,4,6-trideoxy-alpha-D-glucose/dTDP-2,6-dideoxy-D-kanosamine transaminase